MGRLAKRKTKLTVIFSEMVRERGSEREVIMHLTPYCLRVRLKGMRSAYEISPAGVFNHAVRIQVERRKAERARERRAGR